ncbi:hypothetical protein DER46DRAFT_568068 [Fusarium sp. MPI-SDFR-AT-0072]|nr:hypothetical protein DER46DRAFT_568068 [Fusarium sp. MPI-SDFR-AT-0072]
MGKHNITTNTGNQPASEQQDKMEPRGTNETDHKHDDNYTGPPRASFGFELEFLVAVNPRKVEADDSIPGLAPATGHLYGVTAVLELLRDHEFYARTVEESYVPKKCETKEYPWIVTTDGAVSESGTDWKNEAYAWDAVEIASPPMYACDEAYRLVGHPAGCYLLYIVRRFTGIELSDNATADMARREVTGLNFIPRYISRARKLGEDPIASNVVLIERLHEAREKEDDGRFLGPECEIDDSDYECEDGRPFDRPRKVKGVRREVRYMPYARELINEDKAKLLDDESNRTRRDLPPQLDFPASQSTASCRSSDGVPLLDEQRKKLKAVSRQADILSPVYNMDPDKGGDDDDSLKASKAAWRGVTELLACDVVTTGKCRMLEWARDADPSQLMRVIGKLSRDDVSRECTYDVLDFLRDLGMYAELKHCQERLLRAEKAWFECTMLQVRGSSYSETSSYPKSWSAGSDKQDSGDTWGAPDQDWGDQASTLHECTWSFIMVRLTMKTIALFLGGIYPT